MVMNIDILKFIHSKNIELVKFLLYFELRNQEKHIEINCNNRHSTTGKFAVIPRKSSLPTSGIIRRDLLIKATFSPNDDVISHWLLSPLHFFRVTICVCEGISCVIYRRRRVNSTAARRECDEKQEEAEREEAMATNFLNQDPLPTRIHAVCS